MDQKCTCIYPLALGGTVWDREHVLVSGSLAFHPSSRCRSPIWFFMVSKSTERLIRKAET